ncbi:hypothetical protein Syun_006263 [Stephania yunnanensis]|uniref:ER lumen protein-retaining receptor n=1 Tax=Stephania yunnanensis TaxID=152371 RepID=A0AAP0PXD9_9MAGN
MGRKEGKWGLKRLENVFLLGWIGRQSMRVKTCVGVVFGVCLLVALKFLVKDHSHFFVASEAFHLIGTMILIYKLTTHKTCSGLSLKSQELTAIYLAVRLYCSIVLEEDIHMVLDFTTLVSTLWVIYMMRFKLKSTYIKELDNMPMYYVVIPVSILAFLVHPYMRTRVVTSWLWAFCVYLESVSVLPQLRLMQNAKVVFIFLLLQLN